MFITYLKTPSQIKEIEKANKLGSEFLLICHNYIRVGVSTLELEELAIKFCEKYKVRPVFYNFNGFPNRLCVSINDEIIHGLPSDRVIAPGDVVSVDFGLALNGYVSDSAFTKIVGSSSDKVKSLVHATRSCLIEGIKKAHVGNRLNDISNAIYNVAIKHKFKVVQDFGGHGVGIKLHEYPPVSNYVTKLAVNLPLKIGMVIAIEPMLVENTNKYKVSSNGWTILTADGKNAAHFENSVAILKNGPQILGSML